MSYKISHQGTTDKPLSAEESDKIKGKKLEKPKFCRETGVAMAKNAIWAEAVDIVSKDKKPKTKKDKK